MSNKKGALRARGAPLLRETTTQLHPMWAVDRHRPTRRLPLRVKKEPAPQLTLEPAMGTPPAATLRRVPEHAPSRLLARAHVRLDRAPGRARRRPWDSVPTRDRCSPNAAAP